MASAQTGTTCANHRKRDKVATCGVCQSALCIDCIVHTAVGVKCRKCTGGAAATAPTATARAKAAAAGGSGRSAGSAGGKQRRWAIPVAALGVLFVGIAAFAVATRDGGGGGSRTEVASDSPSVSLAPGATASVVDKKADFVGGGGLRIGATLSVPDSLGNRSAPGVLIIPGGGAQDRNGGIQLTTNLPDPLYQDLAESFAQGGLVALRYDRRGTGESQLGQGVPLTWDGLVADAKAGLKFLSERRETQGQPLTVVGYDQGGFVALELAQGDPSVKGLVLLSTPARSLADVIASDFQRGVPDPAKAQVVAEAMKAAAAQVVATGVNPRPETLPEEVRLIFTADAPYLKGLFGYDPMAAASRVRVPTLLVRGGDDASILPGDIERLQGAIPRADQLTSPFGSNTLTLPPEREGRFHNPARHGTTRDGDALFAMTEWIKSNVK